MKHPIPILLTILSTFSLAHAQIDFSGHLIDGNINGARDVEVVDLDGDGDMDVIAAAQNGNEIAWWENDGEEAFQKHSISSSFSWATGVDVADLDEDGDLDVLGAGHQAHTILWWENDGNEVFTQHLLTSLTYAVDVKAIDLDQDGDLDALGSACGSTIVWCKNDGNQNFTKYTIDNSLFEAGDVNAADIDGDGDYDVLGAATGGDYIAWYQNDGNENFTKITIYSGFDNPDCAYPVDLDEDGDMDVVSAAHYAWDLSWWSNDGNQVFTKHQIDNQSGGAYDFEVADIDLDGDLDIASAGATADVFYWYENDGFESFQRYTIASNIDGAIDVFVADIDGNGNMDVAGAACFADDLWWWKNMTVTLGAVSGTIVPAFSGLTVDLYQGSTHVASSLTASDGTYSFAEVEPGAYLVQLVVPFGYVADENPKTAPVTAGQMTAVNFTLTPIPATISGTVSPPMVGLTVNLYDAGNALVGTDLTDETGVYAFEGLSPGTYTVELVPPPGYSVDQSGYPVTVNWGQDGEANPSMTPIPASIIGTVSGGYEGIAVNLYIGETLQGTTEIAASGAYSFGNLNQGDYIVDLEVPAGHAVDQDPKSVHLNWGQTASVDFQLTLLPVSIEVHITPAYAGITIGVSCDDPVLYQSGPTDTGGLRTFTALPGNAPYTVDMVLPLGFTPVTPTSYTEYRTGGTSWVVSFQIAPIVAANTARSKGYWKHQAKANLTGNGSTDYTISQLIGSATESGLTDEIFEHFYGNLAAPIQVAGVTYAPGISNAALDLEDLDATFNGNMAGGNIYKQACQQFLALLLNVTSGKVGQTTIASAEGATHSQAVVYIHDLLTAPGTNYELAKNIAETLDNAQLVANGVIPLTTPMVIFGEGIQEIALQPSCFMLHPCSPNPFNPSTTMTFSLPAPSRVKLSVFDIFGRQVAALVDGFLDAGVHEVSWDAAGLPSGIYCARLEAGSRSAVQKLILLK